MDNLEVPLFIGTDVWNKAHYFSRVHRVVEYLAEHFAEPIDLQTVASVACMERTAFSKSFKQKVGITFREFLQAYRISKAVAMIANSDNPLVQIAFDVGFNNVATFDRVFKKLASDTPSHYRSQFLHRISATGSSARVEHNLYSRGMTYTDPRTGKDNSAKMR
ncbi:MAG TPA: AraC family transcriptional regulator [Terriglobia bacterium]|nr:AraC family transcriptional regulator [Terriglobia bacterium]